MKHAAPKPQTSAFTLPELIILLGTGVVLLLLFLAANAKALDRSRRMSCVNHLKQMGLAWRVAATDNAAAFSNSTVATGPGPASSDVQAWILARWQSLSNGLGAPTPTVLVCPSDTRRPAPDFAHLTLTNLCYFLAEDAIETFPSMLLAGDRNLTLNGLPIRPGVFSLSTAGALGWGPEMHRRSGNLAMGDGSVQQVTARRLRAWRAGETTSARLLIP